MDFKAYIDAFNSGDDDGLAEKWFTEDFVYEGGTRSIEGREAWRNFLRYAHDGVSEIFRPVTTFEREGGHFCEIDMDFHAYKPRPDFPFGPLLPGDMYTVKFFVIYEQRGEQFSKLKAATWPKGNGVSVLPRLGGHVTQRAAFRAFQGALAHEDGANAAQFFADAIEHVEGGDTKPLTRDEAIVLLKGAGVSEATLSSADEPKLTMAGSKAVTLGLNNGLIARIIT